MLSLAKIWAGSTTGVCMGVSLVVRNSSIPGTVQKYIHINIYMYIWLWWLYLQRSGHCNGDSRSVSSESRSSILPVASLVLLSASSSSVSAIELVSAQKWKNDNYNNCYCTWFNCAIPVWDITASASLLLICYSLSGIENVSINTNIFRKSPSQVQINSQEL